MPFFQGPLCVNSGSETQHVPFIKLTLILNFLWQCFTLWVLTPPAAHPNGVDKRSSVLYVPVKSTLKKLPIFISYWKSVAWMTSGVDHRRYSHPTERSITDKSCQICVFIRVNFYLTMKIATFVFGDPDHPCFWMFHRFTL